MSRRVLELLFLLAVALAGSTALPDAAAAQCNGPGGTCGLFGGSCCAGSSCVVGICVANCAGDGGVCVSNGGCCGNRVCALGFCQTPRTLGQACGPGFPCASGLHCDPLSGFVCIGNADLGEACGPLVQCNAGLVCDPLAGFRCVDQTAQLGEACGPLVQCAGGLVCDPLAGFVCVDQTAGLGQACGPLVQCEGGLVCDPLAGFVCVDQNVAEGQACGPLVQCDSGLVCDPLAGFRCVAATTPGPGEACGPLFPCADGLVCDPLAGFRCVDQTVDAGEACGPLVQCEPGLFCDPLAGFRCVAAAGVDEPCGPGVACEAGLVCTASFRCAHAPARAGEACDLGNPCDTGLFCLSPADFVVPALGGIDLDLAPGRCTARRAPGEGCSTFFPCVEDASCQPCFVEGCNAPLQCFPNANDGIITEQTCRTMHSPALARVSGDIGLAMTYGVGAQAAAIVGASVAGGVAYGPDGRYGCYSSVCGGINADISVEAYLAVGFHASFGAVGGPSFVNVQEVQLPGNVFNFSTSQSFARNAGEIVPSLPVQLTGTEDALAVGAGPNLLPFSAGSLLCETELDPVVVPGPSAPAALAVAPSVPGNPGFAFDLGGWTCVGPGACTRADDDPSGKPDGGSGQVASPPPGVDPGVAYLASTCVAVQPGQALEVGAWVKTLGARPGVLGAWWNTGLDCDGALARSDTLGASPADATWRRVTARLDAPGNAQSVQVLLSAERDANSGAASTSRIDAFVIPEPGTGAEIAATLALAALALHRRRAATPWAGSPGSARRRRGTPRPSRR